MTSFSVSAGGMSSTVSVRGEALPATDGDEDGAARAVRDPRQQGEPRAASGHVPHEPGGDQIAQQTRERDPEHDALDRVRYRRGGKQMREDQEDDGHREGVGVRNLEELAERLGEGHDAAALP